MIYELITLQKYYIFLECARAELFCMVMRKKYQKYNKKAGNLVYRLPATQLNLVNSDLERNELFAA